jgi:hypothetical protein
MTTGLRPDYGFGALGTLICFDFPSGAYRLNLLYGYWIANSNPALLAFRKKHGNNVFRGVVAKELALVFFMVRYAIPLHQPNKIRRRIARERALHEMGIAG